MAARTDSRLSLYRAAKLARVHPERLCEKAAAGVVPAEPVVDRYGERYTFDPVQFPELVASSPCSYPGCDRSALLSDSGFCGRHEIVDRNRLYEAEERWCEWCDEPLGEVLGYLLAKGRGRFCSSRCSGLAHREGREITCPGCGDTRYLHPSRIARGERYCSRGCYARTPEARRTRSARMRATQEAWHQQLEQRKQDDRLLDTSDFAERVGLSRSAVCWYVNKEAVEATRFDAGNGLSLLFTEAAVDLAAREIARSEEPQRRRWRTKDFVRAVHEGRGELRALLDEGESEERAEALFNGDVEAHLKRLKRLERRRAGRRRTAESLHRRWADLQSEILAELEDQYREGGRDTPPTPYSAALLVVEDELNTHPQDWPGYELGAFGRVDPATARKGAQRVLKATKHLL